MLCPVIQTYCNGTNLQYNSTEECIDYLTNEIPFGSYDTADQGTVSCRLIHVKFIPLIPEMHCPHVGKTGGDACYNKTVDYYYNQTDFLGCAHQYNKNN
ncbi:unnamed protein product [Adineta steineri]|nr:unnamed protein product [Adineta steineri]CAF1387462.1 unnamed protein product [Adineta steineri]CAF3769301.1 unnamed protein product [Adineta steineri]